MLLRNQISFSSFESWESDREGKTKQVIECRRYTNLANIAGTVTLQINTWYMDKATEL